MLAGALVVRSRPSRDEMETKQRCAIDAEFAARIARLQDLADRLMAEPGLELYEANGDRDAFLWCFVPNVAATIADDFTETTPIVGHSWIRGTVREALERQILGMQNS
jgi:hypothetical protein